MAILSLQAQFPRTAVDPSKSTHGAAIYSKDCARCHGADARGTASAPDLLRSTVVLHDRRENLLGRELAPYLKNTPPHSFSFNTQDAADLSQFLTRQVNGILRSGYDDHPTHLTDGDAKAGEAFFHGAGGCDKCHSTTGDLAHVAGHMSTAALQQKFIFPNVGLGKKAPVTVEVRLPGGKIVTGDLARIDDFTVSLKDKDGAVHSFNRIAGVRVTLTDPYAAHTALLDKYTDADIHNLTTFLDTLK